MPLRECGDTSLVWALWEVRFDWRQFVPRGFVIVALGTALALPPILRSLERRSRSTLGSGGWVALCLPLVAYLGTAGLATSAASPDIRGKPPDPRSPPGETTYEVTPLKIGDKLHFCTP